MESKRIVRRSAFILAGIILVGLVWLLGWSLLHKEPLTGLSGITMVNRPAPDFTLTTFEGTKISMADLKGKPVVINFWASWCPPCRVEAPLLEQARRTYKDRGVSFLGVDIQDKEEDALAYIREFGVTYPNGPDPTGEISIDYGVSGLPVTFFISRDGTIVRRWVGALERRVIISALEEILK